MKLNKGDVIIFPTDTVYGMGASVFDLEGQRKIFEIKNRPQNKRLAVLCANISDIQSIAILTPDAKKLIEKYMPGGLTIILKAKENVVSEFVMDTIAVRIPNHELALRILNENGPMATTSVNVSGKAPLNEYSDIVKEYANKVFYIFPNAEKSSKISSTIIDMTTPTYKLIREGDIKFSDILKYLNK